jgi:alpha-tubulin suppressor-like RCC1 family protein
MEFFFLLIKSTIPLMKQVFPLIATCKNLNHHYFYLCFSLQRSVFSLYSFLTGTINFEELKTKIMKLKLLSIVLFFISVPTLQSQCSYNQTTTGAAHNLAIYSDGALWAWGNNSYGQLGDGTNIDKNTPTKIGINTTWNSISSNSHHNLGIKNDGTLWAWGRNNHGQLGDGTNVDKNTPTQIGTDTNWSTISIGHFHSLALKNDGTLWAWGGNNGGQLGDGTNIDKNTPIQIGTDTNWSKISGGRLHNSGIKNDGTLWAWGDNSFGQLGDGTNINKITPTQIGTDINWSTISSRDLHCLAIKNNGTLWAWGYNSLGQLGIGSYINQTTPTQIGTDTNWNTISANYSKSLAIKNNGTLWGSGSNGNGDLGDGTISNKNILTQIGTDTNWATTISGGNHSIVKKNDGSLWVSGANFSGQLGDGTNVSKNTHSAVFCASTYVPDDGFEANLIALGYDSGPLDDYVPTANISNVTQLHIDVLVIGDPDINDFTGIEDFTALTDFRANFVSAPSIDLSNNTALLNVNVIGNQLTEVNIKNGTNTILQTLNIISVTNGLVNPLKICVDDTAYANTTFGDIYAAGIYYVENCTAQVNRITGTTYFDANNNGSCEPSEAVASNGNIITTGANNSFTTYPFREEYATYSLDQGNVTTQLQGIPTYFTVTPSITTINYTNTGNIDVVDYCLTANSTVNDLQVESYAVTASKPGFQTRIRIKYRNTGSTSLSGAVTLNYPGSLEVFNNAFDVSDGSTSTPFPPTISNNILTWNVTSIAPFETRYIDAFFTINTPTDPNNPVLGGDMMTYISAITPSTGDATPANNTHTFTDTAVNAYDPNDVTCFEGDKISLAQVPDDLTYRIRFQNTGSAAATNILVTNDIDPDLDISTFQPIASSHAHTTTITSPTEIKFTFLNINLADSTTDEPNSHGWIIYKMKPLSTAVIGDTFENNANIFFDYNAPVITNTAITTVAATTSVPDDNFENYLETHDANGNIVALGATNSMGNGIANDNLVFTCNINTITSLNVGNKNIADLSGIEDFVALTELNCSQNQLLNLNISQNTLLEDLFVASNFLTNLNLQQHTALNLLSCYDNQLTNLNLSQNTVLQKLACYNNQLTSLNVKNGYNLNSIIFNSTNNPNLLCIEVDDAAWSTTNWTNIDPASSFSTNCTNFGLTYVPDNNFEAYLEANAMGNGIANDDYVTTANINTVTGLDVNSKNIADLTGIEDFTTLEYLYCNFNQLTNINVTQNINLNELQCAANQLTSLDITQNTNLTILNFNNNNLTSINLNNNTSLLQFSCAYNQLTSIDVSQLTSLEKLQCHNNQLTNLDIAQNIILKDLHSSYNPINSLDITNNPLLELLQCTNNQLSILDISNNNLLQFFNCNGNQISTLDLSQKSNLTDFYCSNNQLTSLNVKNGNNTNFTVFFTTNNPNLACIEVDNTAYSTLTWTNIDTTSSFNTNCANPETYVPDDNFENYLETHNAAGAFVGLNGPGNMGNGIANDDYVTTANINTVTNLRIISLAIADLTGIEDFVALTELNCGDNLLTSINVTQNTALVELAVDYNQLPIIDISQNTLLVDFNCDNNLLTNLNISQNILLEQLRCQNNLLLNLNTTSNTALIELFCGYNQLTNLNIVTNTALTDFQCNDNQLTNIDVSTNIALVQLVVDNNQLTTLNTSANTTLEVLYCNYNLITALDVSQNLVLETLYCTFNQITELDISVNTALYKLYCYNNLLTSLNAKNTNNLNFTEFETTNNPNLICIEVDDATYSTNNWTNIDTQHVFYTDCSSVWYINVTADTLAALLAITPSIDTDNDGQISLAEAAAYTGTLDLSGQNLTDISGLQAFTNVTVIDLQNNNIADFSPLTNASIPIIQKSASTKSEQARTGIFNLEELNISNNPAVETIDVSKLINLKKLMLSDNPNLVTVNVKNGANNTITLFDSSNTPNLTCIIVDDINASYLSTWVKDAANTYVTDEADCRARVLTVDTFNLNNSIQLYPNPVTDILTLKLNNQYKFKSMQVFTILGKLIKESTSKSIDFSNVSKGIYIIKVITENGITSQKILKE